MGTGIWSYYFRDSGGQGGACARSLSFRRLQKILLIWNRRRDKLRFTIEPAGRISSRAITPDSLPDNRTNKKRQPFHWLPRYRLGDLFNQPAIRGFPGAPSLPPILKVTPLVWAPFTVTMTNPLVKFGGTVAVMEVWRSQTSLRFGRQLH